MEITKGIIKTAQKVVIYGPEGIGKSTMASRFPKPLFIDTEGSTKKLDVARLPKPSSWTMLLEEIKYVIDRPELCRTLVIDTIDWAENLCVEHICQKSGKTGIEDFGYGNGYVYEKEEFARFLTLLDSVIDRGIHVLLTAHAHLKKFEQPDEVGSYDRWELKLGKKTGSQISPLVKEWADMVLFANYKTLAVQTDKNGKKFKPQGGRRVMFTTHHPCWDAKNRDGLPEEMDFDYSSIGFLFDEEVHDVKQFSAKLKEESADILEIIEDEPESEETVGEATENDKTNMRAAVENSGIPKTVLDLMGMSSVTEEEIRKTVAARGFFPESTPIKNYGDDFINGWLVTFWDKIVEYIKTNIRKEK